MSGVGNPKGTNHGGGRRKNASTYIARPDGTVWVEQKRKCKRVGYLHHSGYYAFDMGSGNDRCQKQVHRFIAEQLIPNPDPENLTVVDHINRDRTDNRIENLRWSSRHDNFWNSNFKVEAVIDYLESLGYTIIPPKENV